MNNAAEDLENDLHSRMAACVMQQINEGRKTVNYSRYYSLKRHKKHAKNSFENR